MGGGVPFYWEGFCYPIGEKFAILLRKFLLFLWEEECLSIGKVSVIPMGGGVPSYWEGFCYPIGEKFAIL